MPNMRILVLAFSSYRVDKVFITESKKGHNFAIQGPTEKKKKNTFSLFFCTDATYKISSS